MDSTVQCVECVQYSTVQYSTVQYLYGHLREHLPLLLPLLLHVAAAAGRNSVVIINIRGHNFYSIQWFFIASESSHDDYKLYHSFSQ